MRWADENSSAGSGGATSHRSAKDCALLLHSYLVTRQRRGFRGAMPRTRTWVAFLAEIPIDNAYPSCFESHLSCRIILSSVIVIAVVRHTRLGRRDILPVAIVGGWSSGGADGFGWRY